MANVFHLYPEDAFDDLIRRSVEEAEADPAVYQRIAAHLDEVSPALAGLRYALPALRKQKQVMAAQTLELLGDKRRFTGYLELGSHGRYLDLLRDELELEGPIFSSADKPPGYSLEDIVDRGQIAHIGQAIPWSDYEPFASRTLAPGSLGLVTVYIGFHHCPLALRDAFIGSIRDAMAPGGSLILRDHDVTNTQMDRLVGLAHDVFNAGTQEPLAVNQNELRNFYPLAFIVDYLTQRGFRQTPKSLLQQGDPTLNTLMAFTKV